MNKEEKSPATNANPFENAKSIVILRPKTVPIMSMVYKGFEDLEKLIAFVGARPVLNADLSLSFKKTVVKPNSVIVRNSYAEVVNVMTYEEAAAKYETALQEDFDPAVHANKVEAKPVRTRKAKS